MVSPHSTDEDTARRERILNILLLGAFALMTVLTALVANDILQKGKTHDGISFTFALLMCLIFIGLYFLSRRGHATIASYLFLVIFFVPSTVSVYHWGTDLVGALFGYALTILFAGILFDARFAAATTAVVCLAIVAIGYLHMFGWVIPDLAWRRRPTDLSDAIRNSIMFGVVTLVASVANREIDC